MAILLRGCVAAPERPVFLRVLGAGGGRKRPPFTRAPKTQMEIRFARHVGAFSPDPFPVSPVPAGDGERHGACGCPLRRGRGMPVCCCLLPARRKTGRAGTGRGSLGSPRSWCIPGDQGAREIFLDIRTLVRYYVGMGPVPAALTSCHTHGAAAAARKRRCVIQAHTPCVIPFVHCPCPALR